MTNKEVLIQALQEFDGIGEEYITDYISCPYVNYCLNEKRNVDYGKKGWYENCCECKAEWLLKEWEE